MKCLKIILLSLVTLSVPALADGQCGPFRLSASQDGFMYINGVRPLNQKVTFLKAQDDFNNIKMEWMVPTESPGHYIGLEYVKRNGKAILNAQAVQARMDVPQVYGTYDCRKI